jgi:hypothetical protein
MAYVSQEDKKALSPAIKAVMKKYGVKGTIAINNHSSLVANIKSGDIDFGNNRVRVNVYSIKDCYKGAAASFLLELIEALKGPKYFDHSDVMTDYFHRSHYYDINIGQYDKPYVCSQVA